MGEENLRKTVDQRGINQKFRWRKRENHWFIKLELVISIYLSKGTGVWGL